MFYTVFGVIFVLLTRVMPPPRPGLSVDQINAFFHAHATTIKLGFALLMVFIGLGSLTNGLVAFQMKRMSVKPIFAYGYIATIAIGALPGCLFAAFAFLAAVFRPDRDPQLVALLYDIGLLTFVGSLGCFATNYLVLRGGNLLGQEQRLPEMDGVRLHLADFHGGPGCSGVHFPQGSLRLEWGDQLLRRNRDLLRVPGCLILLLRRAIQQQPMGELVQD